MKLKKLAALALAGVMAVSMLAGCATKEPTKEPTETEPTNTLSDSVVAALTEELGKTAEEKNITVTADAGLKTTLDKVVEALGVVGVSETNVETYMPTVDTALKTEAVPNSGVYANDSKTQSTFFVKMAQVSGTANGEDLRESYYVKELVKQIVAENVYSNASIKNVPTESFQTYQNADGTELKVEYSYEVEVAATVVENSLNGNVKYVVACNVVRTPSVVAVED